MKILVLNCGSSSIKYQLIDMKCDENSVLAKGQIERIGLPDGILTHKPTGKEPFELIKDIPDHTVGINLILNAIVDSKHGVIEKFSDIGAVGHRVAHGGEFFSESVVVDPEVKKKIEKTFEIAPLHNPANYKGILAIEALLPIVPQVVVFDTSFHQTIPESNYLYALPYEYYEKLKVRKYGFHGTSHKFVAEKACKMTGLDINRSKIITCHIGNGASVTAVLNGKSFDTSMGFTPVDGLIMGSRCGEVDPSALLYIAEKEELSTKKINDMINKQSGMLGVTGISTDMRDIRDAAKKGDAKAKLAIEMFNSRIVKFVGAYAALMNGVDMIVFTAGIGENSWTMRESVCKNLSFLGLEYDQAANEGKRGDAIISKPGSKVKAVVASTNEELVIAMDTYKLLKYKEEC